MGKELHIDIATGLMTEARLLRSPNCDDRPDGIQADLIVIHGISLPPGEFGGPWIDRFFTNRLPGGRHPYFDEIRALEVSAHVLVRRGGELVQYVPFHKRAWHAGESRFEGRSCCNDFSIGIELEGSDDIAYEEAQYTRLVEVVAALCSTYACLSAERIAGHCDIAPGRKTDPGPAFDWGRMHVLLAARLEDFSPPPPV